MLHLSFSNTVFKGLRGLVEISGDVAGGRYVVDPCIW